jgi:hypothetical protein
MASHAFLSSCRDVFMDILDLDFFEEKHILMKLQQGEAALVQNNFFVAKKHLREAKKLISGKHLEEAERVS